MLRDEKVPMAEKVMSLSDPDTGFIAKGQREPVIGFKPQVAPSGAGSSRGCACRRATLPTPDSSCQWSTKSSVAPT